MESILRYVAIKTILLGVDIETMIVKYNDVDEIIYFLEMVLAITKDEDILSVDPKVPEKLKEFVANKRWDYKDNKDFVRCCNDILDQVLEVSKKTESEKKKRQDLYLKEECKKRELSNFLVGHQDLIEKYMMADYYFLDKINSGNELDYILENPFACLTTINYVIHDFYGLIKNDNEVKEKLENTFSLIESYYEEAKGPIFENSTMFTKITGRSYFQRYIRKTEKNLEKLFLEKENKVLVKKNDTN